MTSTKGITTCIVACGIVVVGAGSSSCAQPPTIEAPAPTLQQIDTLIGSARCNTHADCNVIGVGAQACGGPAGYRAWSSLQTDRRQLEELVGREAALRRQELERLGMQSTCRILPVPAVTCQPAANATGWRCILLSGGAQNRS